MFGTEVCEKPSTAMPPLLGLMATPAFSSPRPRDIGMPSDREHHLIGGDARAVRQMRGEFLAVPVDLVDRAAGENGDAVLFHLGCGHGCGRPRRSRAGHFRRDRPRSRRSRSRQRCRRIPARCSRRPGSRCASAVRSDETLRSTKSRARCRGSPAHDWARRRSRSAHISRVTASPVASRSVWASSNTARVLTTRAPDFSTFAV